MLLLVVQDGQTTSKLKIGLHLWNVNAISPFRRLQEYACKQSWTQWTAQCCAASDRVVCVVCYDSSSLSCLYAGRYNMFVWGCSNVARSTSADM